MKETPQQRAPEIRIHDQTIPRSVSITPNCRADGYVEFPRALLELGFTRDGRAADAGCLDWACSRPYLLEALPEGSTI